MVRPTGDRNGTSGPGTRLRQSMREAAGCGRGSLSLTGFSGRRRLFAFGSILQDEMFGAGGDQLELALDLQLQFVGILLQIGKMIPLGSDLALQFLVLLLQLFDLPLFLGKAAEAVGSA